jgi:hypothetical protein
VLNYKKAQWDQIEKDLTETYKQLKKYQDKGCCHVIYRGVVGVLKLQDC